MSNSNEDSAQTSLQVLLSDDARNHSSANFSQNSVLYQYPGTRDGGWPLETAKKLIEMGYELVGSKWEERLSISIQ
jgi:hypothetical protein